MYMRTDRKKDFTDKETKMLRGAELRANDLRLEAEMMKERLKKVKGIGE